MSVAILQLENRHDPFFEWSMKKNKAYCDKHDIEHIVFRKGISGYSPYWWKVVAMLRLMEKQEHDIVCWMDSDAHVFNADKDLRDFFTGSESMIICPDPPGWGSPFMAAVFMIKNNELVRSIFRQWLGCYNPDAWALKSDGEDEEKWEYVGGGPWAGKDYEQGAFAEMILPKYLNDIKSLPWYTFHEIDCIRPNRGSWSIHIPSSMGLTRPSCMSAVEKTVEGFCGSSNKGVAGVSAAAVMVGLTLVVACYMIHRRHL